MLLNKLLSLFEYEIDKFQNVEYYGNSKTTKVLNIIKQFNKNEGVTAVIVDSKKSAEILFADLNSFLEDIYIFPEIDLLKRYTKSSNDLEQLSLHILNNIISNKKMILIIPVNALYRTIKRKEDLQSDLIKININNYLSFNSISKKLLDLGYNQVDSVENVGEFSKRGSIVDIYSPLNEYPIRLDYFDDELDTIKTFDVITQKSLNKIEEFIISPTTDFYLSENEKDFVVAKIEKELENEKLLEFSEYCEIKNNIVNNIKLYKEIGIFDELYSFSNYIYSDVYSISDYLINAKSIIFDNYPKILSKLQDVKEYFNIKLSEINNNYIFQNVVDLNSFVKLESIKCNKYYLSNFKNNYKNIDKQINLNAVELPFFIDEKQIVKEIISKINLGYEIVISYNKNSQRDYIERILIENNLADYIYVGIEKGKIHFEKTDYLLKGFEIEKNKFILITPAEIFKDNLNVKKKKISFKYSNSEKIRNYQDLNINDYIVHVHHGIGIYKGIENIAVSGINKDFLKIVYEDNDIIYVDIDNMKYIQKYTASTDYKKPKLNKLGTKKWQQIKNKVRKEIEDISEELIKLYIKRELNVGYAFSEDGIMQNEFEQDFLFEATNDQEKAVLEIKKDMEIDRPMDRLLCGDVGFGKTEVAMRVAFKAVMDSKQVAVLVPTTLLAEQHYNNFLERFSNFPVNIATVSRFNTSKQNNEIIEKLASGKIDIIIGTHKLLNDKFKYKDLGLLIIDEEQRFGVKHKEKIKHLKNMIDVLTLSATPIPRTLHMSLVGIRDLSVIETPPKNRQPIQTFVMSENLNVIREAVLKEIERDGQVFYIHNRVETIEEKYLELKRLLPEINIAYAHGRMTQSELEIIMSDLINKEYDMLISTTIIETGIDMPNVNTLIVEDADRFGLSQLYQIRGRVGRSSREAYAYFMYKPFKVLTENSEKRLSAIKNFTSLGSGFKIAMQDLSIRGAGDILGGKQHGFIDSVGYTLYSQMLEKELSDKKEILEPLIKVDKTQSIEYYENIIKEKTKNTNYDIFEIDENKIEIKLNVDAYIPKEYITNDADKIYFYKLINNAQNETDVLEIIDELIDRYSDYSKEVDNLINICLLKIKANKLQVLDIIELKNKIVINFDKEVLEYLNGKVLFETIYHYKELKVLSKDTLILEIEINNGYEIKDIINVLKLIMPAFERRNVNEN